MLALPATFALLAILCYLATAGVVAHSLRLRTATPRGGLLALLGAALVWHGVVMHEVLVQPQGLQFGLFTILVLHAWLLALLALMVNVWRPVQGIYLVALPIAALELGLGVAGHGDDPLLTHITPAVQSHILLSLLAYSVLSIAALQALLASWQQRALKTNRRGLLAALPALQTMENMLFELIAIGFVLLSLAIVTGFIVLDDMFEQHVAHKTVFSLLAWLVFAVLLLGRHVRGWRGRTAVRFTLAGFLLLLLGFVGSQFVLELVLHRV